MYNNGSRGIRCDIRPKFGSSGNGASRQNVPFEFGNMVNREIKKVNESRIIGLYLVLFLDLVT